LAHIATLKEIEAYPAWREAQEARGQAERARRRKDRRDALARAGYHERRVTRVFHREGVRVERATPLAVAELYLNEAQPPSILSLPMLLTCALCFNLKSHPVSCGRFSFYLVVLLTQPQI
jgi:hypothetical protein